MCLFVRSPFYNTHAAPKGIGDNESIAAVRSTYKELCSGLTPSRIYCRAVDGTAWFETGQQLALPCTVSDGLLCRNEDNKESCLDYEIRVRACCPLSALSLSLLFSDFPPFCSLSCWCEPSCMHACCFQVYCAPPSSCNGSPCSGHGVCKGLYETSVCLCEPGWGRYLRF